LDDPIILLVEKSLGEIMTLPLLTAICITAAFDVPFEHRTIVYPQTCTASVIAGARSDGPASAIAPVMPVREVMKAKPAKAKRKDKCGSMTAVWYTQANGYRKYKCRRT
jgi:hypothetical protein